MIQTIGRASRHIDGTVIMYADKITNSMTKAISETERRRKIQFEHNKKNNIQPRTIVKDVRDITERIKKKSSDQDSTKYDNKMPRKELIKIIKNLEKEMNQLAKNLEFEKAALMRDEIKNIRQILKK